MLLFCWEALSRFRIEHTDTLDSLSLGTTHLNTTSVVRVNTRLLMVWSMMQRIGNTVMDMTGDFILRYAMD